MIEAISMREEIAGRESTYYIFPQAGAGDHRWRIFLLVEFRRSYPDFEVRLGRREVLERSTTRCSLPIGRRFGPAFPSLARRL